MTGETNFDLDLLGTADAEIGGQLPAIPTPREPALPTEPVAPDLDLTLTPREVDAGLAPSQQSGAQVFGVAVPSQAASLVAGLVEQVAVNGQNALQAAGVRPHVAQAASAWYRQAARTAPKREPVRHSYNADVRRLPADLAAQLISFFNAMHEAGATEHEVAVAIAWYQQLAARMQQAAPKQSPAPAAPARELTEAEWAQVDQADIAACELALREAWGQSYWQNLETIRSYVSRLPRQDRERLLSLTDDAGHAWLNDPQNIVQLHAEAISNTGPAAELLAEIQQLETYMRDNRAAYNRDEPAQARLRELYRQRDG